MGMSTHVIGYKPADEKYVKMETIYNACLEAGIEIPEEVEDYFEGEGPNGGIEVDIENSTSEWGDDSRQGFEIDLSKLNPDVKFLRFYNSW